MTVQEIINGTISVTFELDSGASMVILPRSVGMTLFNNGTLTRGDYIGPATFTLANGQQEQLSKFRLKSITVGGRTATDVVCAIANSERSLLLGQSFLKSFTSWPINNARGVLTLE